jgi:hypothetical protein
MPGAALTGRTLAGEQPVIGGGEPPRGGGGRVALEHSRGRGYAGAGRTAERPGGERACDPHPVAGREQLGGGAREHLGDRPVGGRDDREPRGERLDQDESELLLPESVGDIEGVVGGARGGLAREHHRGGAREDRGHPLVGDAVDLDRIAHAELGGVLAQSLLFGPRADDQQARLDDLSVGGRDDAAVQRGERAQRVVMPLLPHQAPGRDDRVHRRRGVGRREGEARDVDPGSADGDARLLDALQAERRRRARGCGEEQIGLREHLLAVVPRVAVAVGGHQRQGLPDGLHELEAVSALAPRGLGGEPVGELLGVHDVNRLKALLGGEVAVAEEQRAGVAEGAARQQVAQRAHPLRA